MGESHSQSPLQHRRRCPVIIGFLVTACDGLVPGSTTPDQAQVHSATSGVFTSEQFSSLDIPQATPPPAALKLTTSNNNAPSLTNLPANAPSVPATVPDQSTALNSALNSRYVAPVRSYQMSTIPQKSPTHPPDTSYEIPHATNLAPPPGKPQPASKSRGATSQAPSAASEDRTLLGTSRTPKTPPSPTSERGLAVPGTDQSSVPPIMIPKTAPAVLNVLGSAHNTQIASKNIEKGRPLSSSNTARDPGAISSINNGTSVQKSSTAANRTANMTTLGRPSLIVSSPLSVANTTANVTALSRPSLISTTPSVVNRTTVSAKSTTGSQITPSNSASLFSPVSTTATAPATARSSSSAGGPKFGGVCSQPRGLEMIRLFGWLAGCMMVGARILV